MISQRRLGREWAIQMLAAADVNPPEGVDSFIESMWQTLLDPGVSDGGRPSAKIKIFTEERVRGVLADVEEIDATLGRLLENWDVYRLGTVERAVLRMGVWEILHSDVPSPVVINEAVDLANWFSSPKSRAIVNGVLDKLAKSAEKKGNAHEDSNA